METTLRVKILLFFIINLILLILLWNIPIDAKILDDICLIKRIIGRPCWNCGMTHAFLEVLHLDFTSAYQFNHNVILVFPLTIGIYLNSWYKYIFRKEVKK